jgi:chromosome segregation protein
VERDTVAAGLADADVRIEAAQDALREGESALLNARIQRDTEREALLARRVSLASIAEKIAAARAVETRLGRSASELEERLAHLADEIVATQAGLEETTALLTRLESDLRESTARAARACAALESVRLTSDELRAKLDTCESELKGHRARVDGVRAELQAHEMKLREKRLMLDHLVASVAERFRGVNLPSVMGDYHMRPRPDDVSRARIDDLARLI